MVQRTGPGRKRKDREESRVATQNKPVFSIIALRFREEHFFNIRTFLDSLSRNARFFTLLLIYKILNVRIAKHKDNVNDLKMKNNTRSLYCNICLMLALMDPPVFR